MDSFDESFDQLFAVGYRSAYRILGDSAAAEDVAGEAMLRASSRWRRVRSRALPWVVRVSTNLAIDRVRRAATEPRVQMESPPTHEERTVERLDLMVSIGHLPDRQREVVLLRYFADLSERDTAAALGVAPGTIKSHASRGIESLRAMMTTQAADLKGTGVGT